MLTVRSLSERTYVVEDTRLYHNVVSVHSYETDALDSAKAIETYVQMRLEEADRPLNLLDGLDKIRRAKKYLMEADGGIGCAHTVHILSLIERRVRQALANYAASKEQETPWYAQS